MSGKVARVCIVLWVLTGCAQPEDMTITAEPVPVEPTQVEPPGEATGQATIEATPTDEPGVAQPTPVGQALKSDRLPPTPYTGALPEGAVGVLGMGALSTSVSPDGQVFAVRSAVGVMAYDFNTLAPLWEGEKPPGEITWLTEGRVQIGRFIWRIADGEMLWEASEARQISPDGTLVVGIDGVTVTLYDRESGEARFNLTPPPEERFTEVDSTFEWRAHVSFSPNSDYIAVHYAGGLGHERGTLGLTNIWDLQTGQLLQTLPGFFTTPYREQKSDVWAPDGTKFVTRSAVWDVQSGEALIVTSELASFDWSPDSSLILTSGNDEKLHLWDVQTKSELYQIDMGHPFVGAWSGDGSQFVSFGYYDNVVTIHNAANGESITEVDGAYCDPCAFSTDQSLLLAGLHQPDTVAVWDLRKPGGSPLWTLVGSNRVSDLAWSPDGMHIVSGESGDEPHTIVWDVTSKSAQRLIPSGLKNDSGIIQAVAWSPDGRWITFGGSGHDGFWNVQEERLIEVQLGGNTAFSPDGSKLLDGIDFYNPGEAEIVSFITIPGNFTAIMDTSWSPDGKFVAAAALFDVEGSGGVQMTSEVLIFDVATGAVTMHLDGVDGWISSVAWSPDGTRIAGGFDQDRAVIWDINSDEILVELSSAISQDANNPYSGIISYVSLDWSPDGSLLAGAYGDTGWGGDCPVCAGANPGAVVVWRVDAGYSVVHRWIDEFYESAVVAFNPDGSVLASGSRSGVITLWDMR
jgi:WD40 repeat protein